MAGPPTAATLAERLRAARTRAEVSQQHVADHTGIARSALSDIERGTRRVDALELAALAALYGQPLDHLLGDAAAAPSEAERLLQQLERVTENVHGYLAQRADELAQPLIAAAKAVAAEQVRLARDEQQQAHDLLEETRRQWAATLRRAHRAEHQLGTTHTSGECGACDARRTDAADVLTTPTTEKDHHR